MESKSEYKCERCGLVTKYKCSITKHLKKTKRCLPFLSNISCDELIENLKNSNIRTDCNYKCRYCLKTLNSKSGIYLHEKKCNYNPGTKKINKLITNKKDELIDNSDNNEEPETNKKNIIKLINSKVELIDDPNNNEEPTVVYKLFKDLFIRQNKS